MKRDARLPLGLLLVTAPVVACASVLGFKDLEVDPKYLDGGAESGDASGDVQPPGCLIPPAAVGNEGPFCDTLASNLNRCRECEACHQTDLNACVSLGDGLSVAVKNAAEACRDSLPCTGIGDYIKSPCLSSGLASATFTGAQMAVRTDYCQTCTTNPFECIHFFDLGGDAGNDAGDDAGDAAAGVTGIGVYVALGNDTVAANVMSSCHGGLNCNPYLYFACSGGQWCAKVPADACNPAFCNH